MPASTPSLDDRLDAVEVAIEQTRARLSHRRDRLEDADEIDAKLDKLDAEVRQLRSDQEGLN
jgi:hypothetical protein